MPELFHVMTRAIEGQLLFRCAADFKRYLGLLQLTTERHGWDLHTFVLMTNHVHLLVGAKLESLSKGLWWMHTAYAEHYKRAYRPRLGHVLGGPPKKKRIEDDRYYLAVARYIALNPVGVLVQKPEEYRWSAHRALLGLAPAPPLLAKPGPLGRFGSVAEYERFVTGCEPPEYGVVRRWAGPPHDRPPVAVLSLLDAHDTWGYSIREIARATGLASTTVHRRIVAARGGTVGQADCSAT